MLFGEIIAVYCENHMEHTNALSKKIQWFLMLKKAVYIVTILSETGHASGRQLTETS
jgi:hypothetical protein